MDGRGRDGGTNLILRIKEQETRLTVHEHDDDDDDDDEVRKLAKTCVWYAPCSNCGRHPE